jgi:hypothetical protein
VVDDQPAIARAVDVELDTVGAEGERPGEGLDGVLGRDGPGTAVSPD